MSSVEDVQARPQFVLRGIVLIVAAMFVTSVQDVVFKLYGDTLTLGQIFTLRAILALPLFRHTCLCAGLRGTVLAAALKPWPLLRSLAMTLMFLHSTRPFHSSACQCSARRPIRLRCSSPCFPQPRSASRSATAAGSLFPLGLLGSSFCFSRARMRSRRGHCCRWQEPFYALAHVMTRARCQDVPPAAMVLSVNIIMLAGGLAVSAIALLFGPHDELVRSNSYLFEGWSRLGTTEWLFLGTLAVLTVAISLGIAGAKPRRRQPWSRSNTAILSFLCRCLGPCVLCRLPKSCNTVGYVSDHSRRLVADAAQGIKQNVRLSPSAASDVVLAAISSSLG